MRLGENYYEAQANGDEFVVVAAHFNETVYYVVFFNGALTSMRVPGIFHSKDRSHKWVYNNISYGPGNYNQKLMRNFFRKIIPEEFL